MKTYYTYIITNKARRVLYCGVTNNLVRRIWEHANGQTTFSARYGVKHVVWFGEFSSPLDAIAMEKRIKSMTRLGKNLLIESLNPDWKFLEISFEP